MTNAEIDSIGQGRVWTGKQALELGLVDKLGGLDEAIEIAAAKANLESYKVSRHPAKKDFWQELLNSSMSGAKVKAIKAFMGEEEYNQKIMMQNIKATDVRMALMPESIVF